MTELSGTNGMICDKCGCEHNSRSVCPKCGARVVYVNEDYQRRREEWEKAHRNGQQTDALLPGIMHSTREDYDRRSGRDTVASHEHMTDSNKEGGQDDASLSFDVIKERAKAVWSKFVTFCRKHRKRRGADNPVVRELKFDDGEGEDLDTSKLVLSHKIFKDHRKPIIAVLIAAVLLGAGIPVAVHIIKNIDRSRVFIYDGQYGYYAYTGNDRLIGDGIGKVTIETGSAGSFIGYDDGAIYVCRGGNVSSVKAQSPRIITYNDSMSLAVYEAGGTVRVLTAFGDIALDMNKKGEFTDACAVSDSGKNYVLTTCLGGDDFTTGEYTMYFGNSDGGIFVISQDRNDKEIIKVCDDGRVIFSDMATADYGIINGRTVSVWDGTGGTVMTVADDMYGYRFDGQRDEVYYVTTSGGLYRWKISEKSPILLDDEVVALCDNELYAEHGGIVYRKDNGFYSCSEAGEPRYLTDAYISSPDFYCDYSKDYLYYYNSGAVYFVNLAQNDRTPQTVCAPRTPADVICYAAGQSLLVLADDGTLWELGTERRQLASGVTSVQAVANDGGYAYCQDGTLIYSTDGRKTAALTENIDSVTDIVMSDKKIYYVTGEGELHRTSQKGGNDENLGHVDRIILIK